MDSFVTTCATLTPEAGLAVLTRQRDLYRMLKALADRQRSCITGGRSEELLTLLAERQKVVEQLSGLDESVKTLRERWSHLYWGMGASQRKTADALVAEVQSVLAEVLAADDQDARLLSAKIAGGKRDSLAAVESRRAHQAYGAATGPRPVAAGAESRFLNQTDEEA
jgi:hypothetical protein